MPTERSPQPAILAKVPEQGTFLVLELTHPAAASAVLEAVGRLPVSDDLVIGVGEPLVCGAGKSLPGLRTFPALSAPGIGVPSTQGALFVFLSGGDGGQRIARARALVAALGEVRIVEDLAAFCHDGGRDLTGYEDGTENPEERKEEVALVPDGPAAKGSYVAFQRWVHDLGAFARQAPAEQDHTIGRSRATNEELDDAPPAAHVKRAAQESFSPEAFMLRRSMPWGSATEHGLAFVAYGASLDPFEAVLRRMCGLEDGIPDALFTFTRPRSGGYYFCPPRKGQHLDLTMLTDPPAP